MNRQMDRPDESIADEERQFRLLVDAVVDYAIYMLDTEGRVTRWNRGAARIKGYAAHEIVGRHFSCFYTEEDRRAGLPERALKTALREGKFEAEGWRVRKDGSRFWASVVLDVVRDEEGRHVGFAKVTRDMTERREAQLALEKTREALHQAQKMEALGQLTGGVAHDFNNILTAIINNLELVRMSPRLTPGERRQLGGAVEAAHNGAALIQQLLVFARKQSLHSRPVDVNSLLKGMLMILRRSCPENIEIRADLAPDLKWARIDPNQLQSSILNLVVNARDAMPDGGILTVRTESYHRAEGSPGLLPPGDYVSVSIVDTGTGMAPEVVQHAFEPFFTTKEVGKGTGLGLSMVYGATRQMGGEVSIDSAPGKGTTVRLLLPATETAPEEAVVLAEPPRPVAPRAGGGQISLLYVEDDPLVGLATAEMLENAGYRIHQVPNGAKALAALEAHPEIRLMVTDVGLPGMTGHELADAARSRWPDLKVLFVTGYDSAGMAQKSAVDANTEYLGKPYEPRQLIGAVRRLLDAKETADPAEER